MLLREMTSSALAHSFKRFAQCVVVGLALAGLAACGGGGGGGGGERDDSEPTPCPTGQVRVDGECRTPQPQSCPAGQERGDDGECRTPQPQSCPTGQVRVDGQCRAEIPIQRQLVEYGSVAFAMNPWGASGTGSGTSRTAARDEAVATCERFCTSSSSCGCQEVLWIQNACGSLAYSADNSRAGVGWDPSSQGEANRNAIAACSAAGGQTCRLATTSTGDSFRFCVQAGSATPAGQASTIPARPASQQQQQQQLVEYGSAAFSMNPWGASAMDLSTSRTAARNAAVASCESACTGSSSCGCQEVLWFQNACGAQARSNDGNRAAFGWGETESAANADAIGRCHAQGGQECTVSTASDGRTFTRCAKAGSATPTGQASTIPAKPASQQQQQAEPEPDYAAIAFGFQQTTPTTVKHAWASVEGHSSAIEARNTAQTECDRELGSRCQENTGGITDRCIALAVSEKRSGGEFVIVSGVSAATSQQAQENAIRACEEDLSSADPNKGTCRVDSSNANNPGVVCAGTARPASPG